MISINGHVFDMGNNIAQVVDGNVVVRGVNTNSGGVWINGVRQDAMTTAMRERTPVQITLTGLQLGELKFEDCAMDEPVQVRESTIDTIRTESGSLHADGCTINGDVRTMGGSVRCGDVGGGVHSMGGSVTAGTVQGNLSSMGGSVRRNKRKRQRRTPEPTPTTTTTTTQPTLEPALTIVTTPPTSEPNPLIITGEPMYIGAGGDYSRYKRKK